MHPVTLYVFIKVVTLIVMAFVAAIFYCYFSGKK